MEIGSKSPDYRESDDCCEKDEYHAPFDYYYKVPSKEKVKENNTETRGQYFFYRKSIK